MHQRAEHILAKNPSMPKSEAFAISTQQMHALGKSPKGYGTAGGRLEAKKKYNTPSDDKKQANPGHLESPKMEKAAIVERLARLALTDIPKTPRLLMRHRSPGELAQVQHGVQGAIERLKEPVRRGVGSLTARLPEGRLQRGVSQMANLAIDNPEILPMQAVPIPGLTPAYLAGKKGLEKAIDKVAPIAKLGAMQSADLSKDQPFRAKGKGPYRLPVHHEPAMRLKKGAGTLCINCRFVAIDLKHCGHPYYAEFYGTTELPAPADELCSDWYEPAKEKTADISYSGGDFSPSNYSSHIEGAKPNRQVSGIPSWKQPSLRAPVEKVGEMYTFSPGDFAKSQYSGPLSYGPFKQQSGQPGFRAPSLAAPVEKKASMTSMLRTPQQTFSAPKSVPPVNKMPSIKDVASPKPLTAKFENMQPGALKMTALPGTKVTHV
jgi:hypothetical protein